MQPAKPATAMDVQIIQVSARFNQTFQTIKIKYFVAFFLYSIINILFLFPGSIRIQEDGNMVYVQRKRVKRHRFELGNGLCSGHFR